MEGACSSTRPIQLMTGSITWIDAVSGAMFVGNIFGFVSSIVTLLTNVVATSLIAHQAWYVTVGILFHAVPLLISVS